MTYSRKDKYESRYIIWKGSSGHNGREQRYQVIQWWNMDKISQYKRRSSSNQRKPDNKRNYITGRNQVKSDKRTEGSKKIRRGWRTTMRR